jgi:hypothetical protein
MGCYTTQDFRLHQFSSPVSFNFSQLVVQQNTNGGLAFPASENDDMRITDSNRLHRTNPIP